METFWFFWFRFRRAYDSANDSEFWFLQGHKRPYDCAYDSDSVAIENLLRLDMKQLRTEYPSTFCETACAARWQLFEVIFKWTVIP